MATFPLLADPERYRACETDLLIDLEARRYWLELFESHFEVQLAAAAELGVSEEKRLAAAALLRADIRRIREQPDLLGRLDILVLDELRHRALISNGIVDEFRIIKQRENEAALALLPGWLQRLDALDHLPRLRMIITGMLAGNLFDMGVQETARIYSDNLLPFEQAIARVPPRPWLFDDLAAMERAWVEQHLWPRKAVIFADNAGSDAVLGLFPLVRELLRRGAQVIIAANTQPSLNDVTAAELNQLRIAAQRVDWIFESSSLSIVANGNAAPLIDICRVDDVFAEKSMNADLVVLIGMGRGIESNWSAKFTCACWTIAMIKDPQVAKSIGGKMYDAVCRARSAHKSN